jgi:type 1 fimbria pilin
MQAVTFNLPTLNVPPNAAVGTVIYTAPGQAAIPATANFASCTSPIQLYLDMSGGVQVSSNPYTYATNVPGIGIRFSYSYIGMTIYWNTGYQGNPTSSWNWGAAIFSVQVVVTGPVDSGTINGSLIATMTFDGLKVATLKTTPASVVNSTCSVTTPSVYVSLPTAYLSKLNSGSTGATQFSLGVNCSGGAKVYVSLTDASNVSNTSTTLSLAPGSTATGVGLQILNGSTPVAYGPDSASMGQPNQWLGGTTGGGPMAIPLTVQYVRTAGPLTGGTVRGLATFTMAYE